MSIYKLSAAHGGGSSEASLDFRSDGILYAMSITIRAAGLDALNDFVEIELSFASVKTINTNDVLSSLFAHVVSQNFLTTGGGIGTGTASIGGLKIPVFAGERVHMHSSVSAGSAGNSHGYFYVDDGIELKAAQRRR